MANSRRSAGVDLRSDSLWGGSSPDSTPALRRAFSWLARTGIGVASGSRPIGWVQVHNCHAIDAITEAAKDKGGDLAHVSVRNGYVHAGTVELGSARHFYDVADHRSRR